METPLIYSKMVTIMRSCNAITKGRKNQQQGYNFRGIDDVMNELHEYFADAGVFIMTEIMENSQQIRQSKSGGDLFYTFLKSKFSFYAEDGSHVDAVGIGEAMDSADKSTNKAQSAALKYALLQAFLIPTEEKKDSENDDYQVKGRANKTQQAAAPKATPAPTQKVQISDKALKDALGRVGEAGFVDKLRGRYELSPAQEQLLQKEIDQWAEFDKMMETHVVYTDLQDAWEKHPEWHGKPDFSSAWFKRMQELKKKE